MTEEALQYFLKEAFTQLNEAEYPQMYQYLSYYQTEDEEFYMPDAAELANELFQCDETKALPPIVAHMVEKIYLEQMANGDCEAATDLGALYYTGRIGVQDYTRAMYYYGIAADGGSRQAQENLGYCYYYGRNCEIDYEKAFHYFALGAFDGHLRSLYKVGDMYRNGYYVKQNPAEAYRIYSRCEETLTEKAIPLVGADIMMRLGDCYFEGIGCEEDPERALQYYQKAEQLFYKRLQEGDFLIQGCYERVIAQQNELREKLSAALPDYSWTKS